MDRKHQEKLPAIQLSFIQHLVSPMYQSCAEAGIIPGIMESTTMKLRVMVSFFVFFFLLSEFSSNRMGVVLVEFVTSSIVSHDIKIKTKKLT